MRPGLAAGPAELVDDVVVVAVAAHASLVHLTIDDVIDHDGQVFIRLGDPATDPEPLPRCCANRRLTPLGDESGRPPTVPIGSLARPASVGIAVLGGVGVEVPHRRPRPGGSA